MEEEGGRRGPLSSSSLRSSAEIKKMKGVKMYERIRFLHNSLHFSPPESFAIS